jgi:transcriptional regulator with XRE-family HTH domain
VNTTAPSHSSARDVAYFRQRYKNRVFAAILDFVLQEAERQKITKKDLADRAGKDPAQLNRLLSAPSNMTLETISDILLALGAEADPPRINRFSDYESKVNYAHNLYSRLIGNQDIKQIDQLLANKTIEDINILMNEKPVNDQNVVLDLQKQLESA